MSNLYRSYKFEKLRETRFDKGNNGFQTKQMLLKVFEIRIEIILYSNTVVSYPKYLVVYSNRVDEKNQNKEIVVFIFYFCINTLYTCMHTYESHRTTHNMHVLIIIIQYTRVTKYNTCVDLWASYTICTRRDGSGVRRRHRCENANN